MKTIELTLSHPTAAHTVTFEGTFAEHIPLEECIHETYELHSYKLSWSHIKTPADEWQVVRALEIGPDGLTRHMIDPETLEVVTSGRFTQAK